MNFNEYLNIDTADSEAIFSFYLNFLEELSGQNFPYDKQFKLVGAGRKFINSIEKVSYVNSEITKGYVSRLRDFQMSLQHYRYKKPTSFLGKWFLSETLNKKLLKLQDLFQSFYSETLELIDETNQKPYNFDNLKINDFYKPDKSNKEKIKDLVNEAIDIIKNDNSLSEKCKTNIIDNLNKALRELDKDHVNWSSFLGKIKETVIVLGALGSFVGGASILFNAQEKLEESTIILQQTSINFNVAIINETFNIHNIPHLGSIQALLALPPNTDTGGEENN